MARPVMPSPPATPDQETTAPGAPPDLLSGGRVGKYELLRVIGSGGMGVVYEGRHSFTGKRVAVKVMRRFGGHSAEQTRRFLREARAASSIGHPSIVDVLDAGINEDGLVYLVLELLEGQSLHERIQTSSLSTRQIVDISVQVLDCLTAAHARGIVHRDIKPENVFLGGGTDGTALRVRLLDFGLAKHLGPGNDTATTRDGVIVGTPDFMSPEQARGKTVDARSDLWSTGALMFDAFAGRPPFVAPDVLSILLKLAGEEAPSLATLRPDLPPPIVAVVGRALQKERDARWQTAEDMAAALRAVVPLLDKLDPSVDPEAARAARIAWSTRRGPVDLGPSGESPSESRVRVRETAPTEVRVPTLPASIDESVSPPTGNRRWFVVVLLVLALAAAAVAYLQTRPTPTSTTAREVAAPPAVDAPARRPAVPAIDPPSPPPAPPAAEVAAPEHEGAPRVRRTRASNAPSSASPPGQPSQPSQPSKAGRRRTDPVRGYE